MHDLVISSHTSFISTNYAIKGNYTMQSLQKTILFLIITCCLFIVGASNSIAENKESTAPDMIAMMGMMNPAMYMNMMNPMMGMMNPGMYSNMMNPMMGGMNPMNPMAGMSMMYPMMGMSAPMMGSMMNPMMGMNMMYPMMGMMGPMMSPMGGIGMPGMSYSTPNSNPMGQMMDPKQYENWFNQWTEMMKNFTPPTNTTSK